MPMHHANTGSIAHAATEGDNPMMRAANGETATDEEAKLNFAKAMGFESFSELMEASRRVDSNDGKDWYLTALPNQTWGAWNDLQLLFERHFASREEALENVPHDAELSGTALLG